MDIIRVGVIGCGYIGKDHIRRINTVVPGATVTAVYDIVDDNGREMADKWNADFLDSGEDVAASDNVDAVLIASSDPTHEQYALAAIKNGKYVLCEKPLAPDPDGCRRIMEEEMSGGKRLLQVGFMRRYDAGYLALKECIRSGKFGSPILVHCAHRNPRLFAGYTSSMLITNCAVHEIDTMRWLLEENYAACRVAVPRKTSQSPAELLDPQMLYLETDSGRLIDVEVFNNCQYGYDIRCEIVCEEGLLSLPVPSSIGMVSSGRRSTIVPQEWTARFVQAYDDEFNRWIECMRRGNTTGPTAWDGYQTAVAAAALLESQKTGNRVLIPKEETPEFYHNDRKGYEHA